MNCIVFDNDTWCKPIQKNSPNYSHIVEILSPKVGDTLKVSLIDHGIGVAKILSMSDLQIELEFPSIQDLDKSKTQIPLTLFIGTPRIPVIKRLLKDLSSINIQSIVFYNADLSEKSYLLSNIWNEYKTHQIQGLSQGMTYQLPSVSKVFTLEKFDFSKTKNAVLHIGDYQNIIEYQNANNTIDLIAIGPERGWSKRELEYFKSQNFEFLSMGQNILRVETACISCAVIKSLYK